MARGNPSRWELILLVLILALFILLGWNSLKGNSVTVDEYAHLPAGLSFIRQRDFRLNPDTPPFLRMFAALPLAFSNARLPLEQGWAKQNFWRMGYEFMYANASSYHSLFLRGRAMILILGALLVMMSWWWARRLYGPASGVFAAMLTAFCPNIMAHSGLVTTDIGASLFFLATVYSFWEFCQKPSAFRAVIVGLALGIAFLCKFTSLMLVPMLILFGVFFRLLGDKSLTLKKAVMGAILVCLVSWLTLSSGYFWKGFGARLSAFDLKSQLGISINRRLPDKLRVPLPYDYVRGFDSQGFANQQWKQVYLFGKVSRQGWRSYYLVAMACKMTLASLALILAGIISLGIGKKVWQEQAMLLLAPIIIIGALCFFTGLNLGFRHLLPATPFLYILASRLVSPQWRPPHWGKWLRIFAWALLGSHLLSNLVIYPHYLSYFNLAAGGPKRGYKILADSNIDWGQDLIRLKKYMDEEKLDKICLVYFGRVDPQIYGVNYQLPYPGVNCPQLAISVNFLVGLPYFTNDHGEIMEVKAENFSELREKKPIAAIGYSILIFAPHQP